MKWIYRQFAVIMAALVMFTCMPSTSLASSSSAPDWRISWSYDDHATIIAGDIYDPLHVFVDYTDENYTPALEAMWYKDGKPLLENWEPVVFTNYAASFDEEEFDYSEEEEILEHWYTEWFAGEDGHYKVEVREVAHPDVLRSLECDVELTGWSAHGTGSDFDYRGGEVTLKMVVTYAGEKPDLTFIWYKEDPVTMEDILIENATSDTLTVSGIGCYTCKVTDGIEEWEDVFYLALPTVYKNGLEFEAVGDDIARVYEVWKYNREIEDNECLTEGDVVIPDHVTFADGKARAVTCVGTGFTCMNTDSIRLPSTFTTLPSYTFCESIYDSIYIPPSVTTIDEYAAGYYREDEDLQLIPDFVIYGETGSEAQKYAASNDIRFIDLKALNGVRSSKLPKLTISKPAASKKAITVKWKKLSSKQRKKARKIEIWICNDPFFEPDKTIVKTTSLKKSSYKVKGLKAKNTYYFKVRTIKTVGGTKYVSKWSKVKRIRTK